MVSDAFAQGNADSGGRNLKARDRWMMRGRTAKAGTSPGAMRLQAQQQKLAMRAARNAAKTSVQPNNALKKPAASSSWVPLGPAPLISDQSAYGPVAGRVTSVAVDPSDASGNTVYTAAAAGGVWQSTNAASQTAGNVTWTALTDQQPTLVNGAVSVKPDGSVVLVGTGEPNSAIDSYYGVGILRSTNAGSSWTLIPTATGNSPALSFAGIGFAKFAWSTSPATTVVAAAATTTLGFDDGAITPATNSGLYYSNDSGQTWIFEVPQDAGVAISPASVSATDVVYNAAAAKFFAAIRYHGLYSSTNGQTWTRLANQPNPTQLNTANCPSQIPSGGSNCPLYRGQLAVVPGRNEMYFWFVNLTGSGDEVEAVDEGIWRSTDGGNSWRQIDETGIANCGDPGNLGCGVDEGYYNLALAAVPDGQATDLYAGAVNLFKCQLLSGSQTCATLDSNFPDQWINLTHAYGCYSIAGVHPSQHGMDFMTVASGIVIYFGNDGGIYRALNGYALTSGTCGTTNPFDNLNASSVTGGTIGSLTQFVSLSLHPTNQDIVLGGTEGNGSAATSAATENPQWTTVNGGDSGYSAINPLTPSEWYTANPYVNIYACANGPSCTTDTFSLTVSSQEVGGDNGAFYTPLILDPQDASEMLVGTCRVWRGAPTVPASSFAAISVDFDTLGSGACTGDEVNLVSGLAEGGPTAAGLSTTVYATTEGTGPNAATPSGGEVWVSTNAGVVPMTQVTGPINPSNYTVSSVALDTSDAAGATAYIGVMGFGGSHVLKTTDAGGTGQVSDWTDWSGSSPTALPDAPVNALLVDASVTPSQVYAATDVGVFVSSTAIAGWTEVGTPSLPGATGYLPNVPATAMQIFDNAGIKKLRVSTYGRGIWEYALTSQPDYTNVISNSPQTIFPTQTATFKGALTAVDGYASEVNLSCLGIVLPTTCTLAPAQLKPKPTGTSYTLTAGGTVGDYTFESQGVGTDPSAITQDAAVTLHVVDFATSTPDPDMLTVEQSGTSNAASFQVAGDGSFSGTVNLSCSSGLPSGAACIFSPSSAVTPTAANPVTVGLTVTAKTSTPVGSTTVTLAANVTGAPAPKTQTFTLNVTGPQPDFSLAITATPSTTVAGQNVTWNGTLTALHGYNGTVNLSCIGTAPATCTANPAALKPTTSGAEFTFTVGSATAGPFDFSIQGTDGTLTHAQPVNLNVATDVTWSNAGSSSATVQAGQGATYKFSAAPLGGRTFSAAVSFACANLPALTGCSFNPPSLSSGAGTTPVTVTISTTGPNAGTEQPRALPNTQHPALGHKLQSRTTQHPRMISSRIWWLSLPAFGFIFLGLGMTRRRTSAGLAIISGVLALIGLAILVACGAIGAGAGGSGTVVTVSPSGAIVELGAQQQFSATVVNGSSQNVTWSVSGGVVNGNIDSGIGLYTAPGLMPASSTISITATSQSNPSASGSATVTLTGGPVTVTVSPATLNLFANVAGNTWQASATQQQFSATVNNAANQSVNWAVVGGNSNGTINAAGLYAAPASVPEPATVTVTASSPEAASQGLAIVTIEAPTPLGTYPNVQVTATATGGPAHTDLVTLTVN